MRAASSPSFCDSPVMAMAAGRDFWASRGAWASVVSRIYAWASCISVSSVMSRVWSSVRSWTSSFSAALARSSAALVRMSSASDWSVAAVSGAIRARLFSASCMRAAGPDQVFLEGHAGVAQAGRGGPERLGRPGGS